MAMSDPISDLLTRIRNANLAYLERVEMPSSRMKQDILNIMREEGFIKNFRLVEDRKRGVLRVYLKYGPQRERVISGLCRVSRPSLRVYVGKNEIPLVMGGLGTCILSTPKGIMTGQKARRLGVGGELLCKVW
ncbi:MAG TPA: 30S ribosomal protein S8 [bacterium]|nr:30S ribosomal protein S8 [bacterium]